jgi:hypothetical protein
MPPWAMMPGHGMVFSPIIDYQFTIELKARLLPLLERVAT